MAVQWGIGLNNGTQNAFQMGMAIGDSIRQRNSQNALSGYISSQPQAGLVATPEQQAASDAAWQKLVRANPEAAYKIQAQQAEQQMAAQAASRKQAAEQLPVQINLLRAATPENWTQLRQQAISRGLGTEQSLPQTYDQRWVADQIPILTAMQEKPDLFTNEVKTILAGLPPEQRDLSNPAAYQAVARAAEKVLALQPGGSAIGYNPSTGQSRTIVAQNPGNMPAGAPVVSDVPPPPAGFQLDGGPASAPGTFP